MIHVLGELANKDLAAFISVFATAGATTRAHHGCLGTELYSVADDEQRVMILFTWESEDAFHAFTVDPAVKENMVSGGMIHPPRFTVLNKVGEFPS